MNCQEQIHRSERWTHTPDCTRQTQTATATLAAWKFHWPSSCTKCHAWGVLSTNQSVPYGDTNATLDDEEPCENCIEKGACPRCGEMINATDDQLVYFVEMSRACPLCGWQWGKHKDDTEPEIPECYCWEEYDE